MEETLEKVTRVKGMNYFTFTHKYETLLKQAQEADKRYSDGTNRPLEGIPMCLKDNIDSTDGSPTTAGSPVLKGNHSKTDS